MKAGFNLSAWGLAHPQLVLFAMVVLTVIGLASYLQLGQSEDPPFTFKVMVVTTRWPGASALEVEQQVTDKIEKKLREMGDVETLRSYSRPGESQVIVVGRDSMAPAKVPDLYYQVRKKIGDIRHTLPQGVLGPFFNDEFGDTFGNIFALMGEGVPYTELKRYADAIRQELLTVPDVAKVEFFGEQDQRIYVEFSPLRIASLGIDPASLASAIAAQNAKGAAGYFELQDERIYLRPEGDFSDLDAIRALPIRAGGRTLRLGDIAEVHRGYVDPPVSKMRFKGREALGIGVSMREGGDIIALGKQLDRVSAKIETQLPRGLQLERVADQPRAVSASIHDFVKVLTEAVVIVLAVSLMSLGFRTGVVVAISIPVVLAITFLFMHQLGIGLHKISLGTLVLALGLLVDDAIIAVEMMAAKMEQGWDRVEAASFAYTSTAMPMLSGTLVTAAGFLPIATAASSTGEYTRSIFEITVIALLVSWVAAVLFVPFLGYYLLPDLSKRSGKTGLVVRLLAKIAPRLAVRLIERREHAHSAAAVYATPFYRRFRVWVAACVKHRWKVIAATLIAFVLAIWGFRFVPQQFFPESVRPELLVDLRLAQGASLQAVERSVKRLEVFLDQQSGIENYVAYVGSGSPRFYLPLDQQLPQANFAQFVILAEDTPAREALRSRLIDLFASDFPELRASISRLETGPPVGFPVQYRVRGPDHVVAHRFADQVATLLQADERLKNVHKDWDEASKVVRVRIDPEKARIAGFSRETVQAFLAIALNGGSVTQLREGTETIDVYLRGARRDISMAWLAELAIPNGSGRAVPLSQIASLEYAFEPGIVWRRNRSPTVTVRANLYDARVQPAQVVASLAPEIAKLQARLPLGYHLEVGGAVEESAKGSRSVAAGVPLFILVVLTVLMLQLQNFSRMAMVLLTAPLGIIGVTLALLGFGKPFGFVAMLGTIALSGMIMRNSVILIDQIDQDEKSGLARAQAIIEATVRRFRPIMLTAAAAILAMIPLSRSAFFGPMAVAIMGGLAVATVLTLFFVPALYAAWYRVPRGEVGG